jgi:pimeloyl-ACP methyl ester carboxylesterase
MSRDTTVAVWQQRIRLRVQSQGNGRALVYFHGPWGLAWDPFLDALAQTFTVHAPEHPGTTAGAPNEIYELDNLWDLLLCYDELLDGLGIEQAVLVGHSFGGMIACELAALTPRRAHKLVLIDPIGFWRDAEPVVNWMALEGPEMRRRVFKNPSSDAAKRLFADADDAAARVRVTWAMGSTGKFIWPIPDKGLKKRIHRVKAPTLLVWGKEDSITPLVYADEFTKRLSSAQLQVVDGAAHAPHLEQPEMVARMVREFAGK